MNSNLEQSLARLIGTLALGAARWQALSPAEQLEELRKRLAEDAEHLAREKAAARDRELDLLELAEFRRLADELEACPGLGCEDCRARIRNVRGFRERAKFAQTMAANAAEVDAWPAWKRGAYTQEKAR